MHAYQPMPCSLLFSLLAVLSLVLIVAPASFAGSDTNSRNLSRRVHPGETIKGKATYYPNRLNGHTTASGATFHQSGHTAASNRIPLGTDVKVTNLKNGKSTGVTLTDRGPALGTKRIDLSKRAAKDIGLTHKEGAVPVRIKVTRTPDGREAPPEHPPEQ